jgi:molybdenum cofactor cytidylyltransferase
MNQPHLRLATVILAAGASTRMARPKLLLPWGATSVLGHLLEQWRSLQAEQIAVVLAANDQAIADELQRLGFPQQQRVLNPAPQQGMFSSIQCAARWTGWHLAISHWVIVLGDQPHLQRETLRALVEFAAGQPEKICQPSRHGRARHPVLLPKKAFAQLKDSAAESLKQFLQAAPQELALCEINDPGLDFDIDQPADYEKAAQLYFRRA